MRSARRRDTDDGDGDDVEDDFFDADRKTIEKRPKVRRTETCPCAAPA